MIPAGGEGAGALPTSIPVPARLEVRSRALASGLLGAAFLALGGFLLVLPLAMALPVLVALVVLAGSGWWSALALLPFALFLLVTLTLGFGPFLLDIGWSFLRELWTPGPRLVLDERGLTDRQLGLGTIPWEDVSDARSSRRSERHLSLMLRDPSRWLHRFSRGRRAVFRTNVWARESPFVLNLLGTDADPEEVLATIRAHLAAAGARLELTASASPEGKKPEDTGGGEERASTEDWIEG